MAIENKSPDVSREHAKTPPKTLWGYLRNSGPGIVVAMLWLGTGDLVDSSVSGGNYGYAFMWAIVVATVARYFVTSALAKYQLCNANNDETILDGFGRIWRGYPMLLAIGGVILAFGYNASLLLGSALALHHLFGAHGGDWGTFGWAVLICGVSVFMATRRGQYKAIEWTAIASVLILVGAFLVALGLTGIDAGEAAQGFAFGIPQDKGPIAAIILVVSLIGGVGGSANNLLYTYFLHEKGWRGPTYRRQQMYDLLFGIIGIIVIDLAIWMVAAKAIPAAGLQVTEVTDLAQMMVYVMGPIGGILLWIGLLGAAYDGYPALAFGYSKMFVGAVHQTFPSRAARFKDGRRDPIMQWVQIPVLLILPLVFSLPVAPSFIVVTVFANAIAVVLIPAIVVGVIWVTNKKTWLLPGWVNSWWENLLLVAIGGVGVWATYNLIRSFF